MQISWIVAFSCVLSAANYTTYIGDPSASYGVSALATDANGNTYVTGTRNLDSGSDIYVSKIDSNGNLALLASFGLVPPSVAQRVNSGSAIAVDASGNIFVAGATPRPDFPVVKALQSTPAMDGGMTGFVQYARANNLSVVKRTRLRCCLSRRAAPGVWAVDLAATTRVYRGCHDIAQSDGRCRDPAVYKGEGGRGDSVPCGQGHRDRRHRRSCQTTRRGDGSYQKWRPAMTHLQKRLLKPEEKVQPNAETIVIQVVFVNAAKERVGGFQVTILMSGHPRRCRS